MADTADRAPGRPQPAQSDAQTEQNMRRALGLNTRSGAPVVHQQRPEQARARHRFVQDGGVPVTVLNPRSDDSGAKDKITALQAQLEAERGAHAGTRRALMEAQAATQALQTRLAHAELAHQDALKQEQQNRLAAQSALAEALAAAPPARRPGRPPRPAYVYAGVEPPPRVAAPAMPNITTEADGATPEPVKPKRGRPRTAAPREPKPVRWWTPSFRKAKAKPTP